MNGITNRMRWLGVLVVLLVASPTLVKAETKEDEAIAKF